MVSKEPMQPVVVTGRKLADNWWGLAWDRNLERYSDYENRLPRGRTYLRGGHVIDLRIEEGLVRAKVKGSRARPYTVTVRIEPLSEEREREITSRCANRIETLEALVSGTIPEDVMNEFVSDRGLFPNPREISFQCTCPDWANMCKHVSAVLYGIGKRFDDDPLLFFKLRSIDFEPFIGRTVQEKLEMMLANADRPSGRIIPDDRLSDLFGITDERPHPGGRRPQRAFLYVRTLASLGGDSQAAQGAGLENRWRLSSGVRIPLSAPTPTTGASHVGTVGSRLAPEAYNGGRRSRGGTDRMMMARG